MKLVNESVTYEKTWEDKDEPDESKWPVFVLKKLSAAKVNSIDDRSTTTHKGPNGASVQYLAGTIRRLKVDAAVVDWRNMFEEDGNEAKCSSANKEKLPADVQSWLEEDINETNRLNVGMEESERKN